MISLKHGGESFIIKELCYGCRFIWIRGCKIVFSVWRKEIMGRHKEVKAMLWGGTFWTSGYYVNTVGAHGNEEVIKEYVANQGQQYRRVYRGQIQLFEGI